MKVIFKNLKDIKDKHEDPVLVEEMEYLFDGKTVRDIGKNPDSRGDNNHWFFYDRTYYVNEKWFDEYKEYHEYHEYKDVMNLFSMEI